MNSTKQTKKIAAVAAVYIQLNSTDNKLSGISLANVEVVAYGDTGVDRCDIIKYTRNAKEKYVSTDVKANAQGGLYASYQGKTIKLGIQASAGGTVGIPDCVDSNGNCCEKSFIEKSPKYY